MDHFPRQDIRTSWQEQSHASEQSLQQGSDSSSSAQLFEILLLCWGVGVLLGCDVVVLPCFLFKGLKGFRLSRLLVLLGLECCSVAVLMAFIPLTTE